MFHDFIMTDLNEDSKQLQSSHISNLPLVEFKSTIFGIQMPNFWMPIVGVLKKKSSLFADVFFHICRFFVFAGFCLQMVIERSNLREEEKGSSGAEEEQIYYIQLAQLVIVVALILAVWVSKVTSVSDYDLVSFLVFDFGISKSNTVPTFMFRLSVLLCIHSGVSRVRRQVFRKQKQKNLQKLKLTNDMLPAI